MAGVIIANGLLSINGVLKRTQPNRYAGALVDTYAIFAAPKIPNLTASLFFSAVGGQKAVKMRFTSDAIEYSVFLACRWL